MDGITVNDIFEWVKIIAAFITSATVIYKLVSMAFRKTLNKALDEKITPISEKLDALERKHDLSDREQAKNFIVRFLADVEQGQPIDADELHCFWDNYELYKAMGGNSYIHDKVEKLKAQGKL